jgi:DegV family protein with EDD domain
MAVRYLDGTRLRRSMAAASRWVSQRQENLNGINVFPVPDGDTGTNIAATLVSAVERARRVQAKEIGPVSRALADGALFGACGNSGVILAQFFEGFASRLDGHHRADGVRLAEAIEEASSAAQAALAQPREGTILTVMRVWASRFKRIDGDGGGDLLAAFRESLDTARDALARTPKQLKELARAGVVDAGAQGFVYFLEGILNFAEGRVAGEVKEEREHAVALGHATVAEDAEAITFRYCTEVLLEGQGLELSVVRDRASGFGDSLVVAGSPHRLRVHVHTDEPEAVFEAMSRFGEVVRTKADDMRVQHRERFEKRKVAIVTDTGADMPDHDLQRLRIHTVPLRVVLGSSVYLDRQTLNPDEVYEQVTRGEERVTTSQPAPGDYAAIYEYLFEHYDSIVVPSLSGALSGTLGSARTAAGAVDPSRITVTDTRSASVGEGLVVRAAAERALAGADVDEVVEVIKEARERVRIFVGIPTVKYMEQGGRLTGWKARMAHRLPILPMVTLNPRKGTLRIAGVARRGRVHRTTLRRAKRALEAEPRSPDRVWVGHAGAPEVADALRAGLSEAAPGATIEIVEVSPVVGAHTGPGSVAVAFLSANRE